MDINIKRNRVISIIVGGIIIFMVATWISQFFKSYQRNILSYSTAQRNISYCSKGNLYQVLDYYRPKHTDGLELPVVIYMHGGGWSGGRKDNGLISDVWGPHFLKQGLAVVSIEYQMKANKLFPTENDDIACALAYLKKNAKEMDIDIKQSIFFGDSAGAQLASYAALNTPYKDYDYEVPKGVIDFYGVSNFSPIVVGKPPDYNARHYLGADYIKKAPRASPVNYVHDKAPPFLLIHGTGDTVVPHSQSQLLYKELKDAGVRVNYVEVPQAPHAFKGPELNRKEYRIIKRAVDAFLMETIDL